MSKKDFIALAESIMEHDRIAKNTGGAVFSEAQLDTLADFCRAQNSNFKRERWLGYIRGENGPSGGAVKRAA